MLHMRLTNNTYIINIFDLRQGPLMFVDFLIKTIKIFVCTWQNVLVVNKGAKNIIHDC